LLIPPLSILAGLTLAVEVGLAVVFWLYPSVVALSGLVLALLAGAGLVFYVLIGMWLVKAPAVVYRRLLCAPLYVIWKLWVYAKMALRRGGRKTAEWVRTERHDMRSEK
jgi:hypothetical protein